MDQAAYSGSSFLLSLSLARLLSPLHFGYFASVQLALYFAASITAAVLLQPLQVNLAGIQQRREYLNFNFWGLVLLCLLLLGVVLLLAQPLSRQLNLPEELLPPVVLLGAGFLLHDFLRKLFLALDRVKAALQMDLLFAGSLLSVVAYAFYSDLSALSTLLTLLSLCYLLASLIGIGLLQPGGLPLTAIRSYLFLHYQQARWLLLTAIVQWWSGNLFVVASGLFLGVEALGAFRLVQSLFGVLNLLFQTFENYALPRLAEQLQHSRDHAIRFLRKLSRQSLLLMSGLLLLLLAFAKPIIYLAGGAQYTDYAFLVRGMALLYGLILLGYPLRMAVRALILNRSFFFAYVLSLLVSLLSYHYLLSTWRLRGVVAGLFLAQLCVLIYWYVVLRKNNFMLWKSYI